MNLDYKYKMIGISSSWPNTNDCLRVEVTTDTGKTYIAEYMKKEEYNLIIKLQMMLSIVPKAAMKELIKSIEEYGDMKYSVGSDDEQMSNAGPEL